MAMQHGWRWSNPTGLPASKQAQIRPGEPTERWERDDHWAYLVERGGQWTLTHRGIDGDIETGKANLSEALTEFRSYHVAYAAMSDALFGVKTLTEAWSADAPCIALAKVDEALNEARPIVAAEHDRLLAAAKGASKPLPVSIAPEHLVPHPPAPPLAPPGVPPFEYPSGVKLTGVEYGTPDGAVALGTIELPGSVAGVAEPVNVEVRVTLSPPERAPAAPMLAPKVTSVALVETPPDPACVLVPTVSTERASRLCTDGGPCAAGTVCAPGQCAQEEANAELGPNACPPSRPPRAPEPPWAIPADPEGKATIPIGYARTIVALTIEAFTNEPQVLVWDVDLKTDLGTPPDDPSVPNAFRDGRWTALLGRLQGAIRSQANDPAAQKPLIARISGVVRDDGTTGIVLVDLEPALVNMARIGNGPPPVGRWFYAAERVVKASVHPHVPRAWFLDGVPF